MCIRDSFKVGPLDTVVLKISSTHLEIVLILKKFRNRHKTCPKGKVCSSVRQAVEAGIRQVTSDINYVNAQHSFTFPCGCKSDHPGELEFVDDVPFCLSCSKTNKQHPLPTGYRLWKIRKPPKSESEATEHKSIVPEVQPQLRETSNNGEGKL